MPIFPCVHGNFTDAVKMSNPSAESEDLCDDETLDMTNEDLDISPKFETLNSEKFLKSPSVKLKVIL